MPDPFDPHPAVSAAFSRAASALAGFAAPGSGGGYSPAVTVTTADLATVHCPWSLAWAEVHWEEAHRLLILRHVEPGWEAGVPWDDADPLARLATLGQLPTLLDRVVAAAGEATDRAEPGAIEEWGRQVDVAIGGLGARGPEREGGRADG
jgi:hypothetical protein